PRLARTIRWYRQTYSPIPRTMRIGTHREVSMVTERDEAVLLRDGIVRAERIGHILLITLNRPEARNAMTTEQAIALGEVVELLETDPELRVGVLTGAGKAFCAGQDLKELSDGGSVIPDVHPEWGFGGF